MSIGKKKGKKVKNYFLYLLLQESADWFIAITLKTTPVIDNNAILTQMPIYLYILINSYYNKTVHTSPRMECVKSKYFFNIKSDFYI